MTNDSAFPPKHPPFAQPLPAASSSRPAGLPSLPLGDVEGLVSSRRAPSKPVKGRGAGKARQAARSPSPSHEHPDSSLTTSRPDILKQRLNDPKYYNEEDHPPGVIEWLREDYAREHPVVDKEWEMAKNARVWVNRERALRMATDWAGSKFRDGVGYTITHGE